MFVNLFPLIPACTARPGLPLSPPEIAFLESPYYRPQTASTSIADRHHPKTFIQSPTHKTMTLQAGYDNVKWSQIISAHAGYLKWNIRQKNLLFSSSFGRHSFEFRRVLTAARQQWTINSDSELDFDGFVTVEFGENGHFAANLAPETMSIDFFFFLTGSSDVNSDSSDAHSASIAMSLTATILWHPDVG